MKRIYAIGLALLLAPAGAADTAHASESGKIKLRLASTFPGGMPLIGAAPRLAELIARATGGEVVLGFHEPDKLVPAARTVFAVSEGKVDAGFAGAGWFTSVDSAFNLFSTVPPDEAQRNPSFRRIYDSYRAFRRDYALWNDHAYIK